MKHEFLKQKDYYETRTVSSARKEKDCEHCGDTINIGQAHDVHYFYSDDGFENYPTHNSCTKGFMISIGP